MGTDFTMIELPLKNRLRMMPWLASMLLTLLTSSALCDDTLTNELQANMTKLLADHEFGLPTYASEALMEIESSPDSVHWFQGKAKFTYFLTDQLEFRNADWDLKPSDDSRRYIVDDKGRQLTPHLFDFKTCSRSTLKYRGINYDLERRVFEGNPGDKWQVTEEPFLKSTCVAIDPLTWPFVITTTLSRNKDQGKSMLRHYFGTSLCAKATQTDSRTVHSVWYSKATTPDGKRLVYENITFKDGLPTVIESLSYQAGFRDMSELPIRKKCKLINNVETTWTQVDDVPVPEKVVARLQSAGFKEVNELSLNVRLKYWVEGAKEYQAIKTVADQAAKEIDKINSPVKVEN